MFKYDIITYYIVYIIYAQCIYWQLAKNEKDNTLVDLDLSLLPPLPEQEEENIDVGQDDFFNLILKVSFHWVTTVIRLDAQTPKNPKYLTWSNRPDTPLFG